MSFITISPNMNLPVPNVGQEPGPDWANDVNNSLNLIDSHDHTNGNGVKITPSGLNINAALDFQNNPAVNLSYSQYISQPTSSITALRALYSQDANGDLWWNDGAGNTVQITDNGSVAGTPGSITNLVPPASVTYFPGSQTLVFVADAAPTPMTLDAGSIIIRDLVTPFNGITLGVTSLSAPFSLNLPNSLPLVQSFMTMDAAGNINAPWTVDNTTIKITANQLVAQPSAVQYLFAEHSWELNGKYASLTYPLNGIDSMFFAPYNIEIQSIWIFNGAAGTGGTTEFNLRYGQSTLSTTTILSTTGKITSAAAAQIWTDSGSVIGAQTGVTKPVLSITTIPAGYGIKFELVQSMTGPCEDARIRMFYKRA